MEVKGYRSKGDPVVVDVYDNDIILDYVESAGAAEIIVIEPLYPGSEEIIMYFFVREDGEQLTLDLEGVDDTK